MKIELLDLTFTADHFYLQKESIVEKITFNNRTFYTKFERQTDPFSPNLIKQHLQNKISLAVPLVEQDCVNYIVIEYQQDDWRVFHSLIKHLLKSLNMLDFSAYYTESKELFQLFIPKESLALELAYKEVDTLKHLLELKSRKNYKIYPNINLPQNFNIITLPTQKV